jgi:hypothetical protein
LKDMQGDCDVKRSARFDSFRSHGNQVIKPILPPLETAYASSSRWFHCH